MSSVAAVFWMVLVLLTIMVVGRGILAVLL
jgi:hypothetical protein